MKYRDCLYKDYSNNFGSGKPSNPEIEYGVFERTYANISEIEKTKRIVDLGCGRGEWLMWLDKNGFQNLVGVDVAGSELAKAFEGKDSLALVESDVTSHLQEQREAYDLLHAKDIFEHFTKDEAIAFLESSLTALKPEGELWILTYNAQAPLAEATGSGDFTHELAVTPSSMAQAARAVGFKVLSIHGYVPARVGLKGTLRSVLYDALTLPSMLIKRLRHGSGRSGAEEQVELHSLRPDLFIRLKKSV